jgi:hypothetical protein
MTMSSLDLQYVFYATIARGTGLLGAALHVMWWESPYRHGVLDFIGTGGIVVAMLGIVVWCVCAWLGSEEGPTPLPPARHGTTHAPTA